MRKMSLGRVLVVDDDKNICELLRLYLEKEGYGVILAHDGEEAVVKFNALHPDIVLLEKDYIRRAVEECRRCFPEDALLRF